jgi:hypothetical protein
MGASLSDRLEARTVFSHTPPNVARTQKVVLDADAIQRSVRRIAVAILEATSGIDDLTLIGIRRGGVPLSARISEEISKVEGRPPRSAPSIFRSIGTTRRRLSRIRRSARATSHST